MIRSVLNRSGPRKAQRGFSMIEVLVTLLVISLALLGTAGLQAYSMRLNQGGQFRTYAVFLVADLAERIEANKSAAVAGKYVLATSSTANTLSTACVVSACTCTTADCTALANFDLSQWQNLVAATLPQPSWTVAYAPATPKSGTYTITVSWVDRRTDTTDNRPGTGETFSYTATRGVFDPITP